MEVTVALNLLCVCVCARALDGGKAGEIDESYDQQMATVRLQSELRAELI